MKYSFAFLPPVPQHAHAPPSIVPLVGSGFCGPGLFTLVLTAVIVYPAGNWETSARRKVRQQFPSAWLVPGKGGGRFTCWNALYREKEGSKRLSSYQISKIHLVGTGVWEFTYVSSYSAKWIKHATLAVLMVFNEPFCIFPVSAHDMGGALLPGYHRGWQMAMIYCMNTWGRSLGISQGVYNLVSKIEEFPLNI